VISLTLEVKTENLTLKFTEAFRPLNDAEEKSAPKELYISGDLDLLRNGVRVSIIGSRDASPDGIKRARKLTKFLVERHISIVSGLAKGIDTAAHTAAIELGGKTIGVIGTPLSGSYPAENRNLQQLIAREQLLISQFPEGAASGKHNFPIRDRLMALIADATVIIEAKDGSGTTHQGWEALRLARPLWITESAVKTANLKWPQEFLRYGARILSDESLAELQDLLPERNTRQYHDPVPF